MKLKHIVYFYNALQSVTAQLREINMTLDELKAKADATLASVTEETALSNAVAAVVNDQRATITDLRAQLEAAGTDPAKLAALGETMDHILALNTSNAKIVSDAVAANTGGGGGEDPVPTPTPDA